VVVRDTKLAAGAGFVVAYAGDIMTMPGLPKEPSAETIDIDADGNTVGLF
jgi:formate--tetrahydrofolate ligase